MKLLDLYCGQGGAAMGYYRAGFDDITGVDIKPMPRYPFRFIQGDALEYLAVHGAEYGVIHASPVCKGYSVLGKMWKRDYPDQIPQLREMLKQTGKPYVIENVPGAPLKNYVMLCGTMFGLRVIRHRIFECNPPLLFAPKTCNHWARASSNSARIQNKRITPNLQDFDILTISGHDFILADALVAMGIDWMDQAGISQAIPWVYTEYIGKQLLA